jgi:seryl-tRNA synthetase
MQDLRAELDRLQQDIGEAGDKDRLRYQPQLERVIEEMDERGEDVPPEARDLNEELRNAAIEAQFDNMPI